MGFLTFIHFSIVFKFVYLKIIINEHDCTVYRIQGVHTRWKCSDNNGSICVAWFSINGYKKRKKKSSLQFQNVVLSLAPL